MIIIEFLRVKKKDRSGSITDSSNNNCYYVIYNVKSMGIALIIYYLS